jgi:DNA-binding response OmpR family regulator
MTAVLHSPLHRLLIVEDELDLREAIVSFLQLEGFAAHGVANLQQASSWMAHNSHDILVLDLGLPDGDGLEWLQNQPSLRQRGVIITTARGLSKERIAGIKAGADAYFVKPVQLEELAALCGNLLQRLHQTSEFWALHTTHWTLQCPQGMSLKLTRSEHLVLHRIAQNPGEPVDRNELILQLGKNPEHYDLRRLEVLIRRLRTKTQDMLQQPLPLTTVHKQGYAFTAPIKLVF